MSCSFSVPNYSPECDDVINPYGDDFLNQYLVSSKTDFNGNVTLNYEVPNWVNIQSVNKDVVLTNGGALKDKPGYKELTAYIKSKKAF